MALFVDLDEEAEPPQAHHYGLKPQWNGERPQQQLSSGAEGTAPANNDGGQSQPNIIDREPENLNEHNGMAEALGCYPIVMAIASSIDLNTLDNLSRTCRQVRQALLQYRSVVLAHTLHCVNEDVPIDPEDTFRYRARAGNWYYMEDGRTGDYSGKSGSCARDMVAECRRCGTVVCRNCAIKPPAPAVLRDRHRRLCLPCSKAPLGSLVKPPLRADTTVDADEMRLAICTCASEGVWLCQPCGRSIRGDDHGYKSIWKWRNQYGEVLGGLGTGIGEGDRGVICGREAACCGSKEREQETDCDAADAREQDEISNGGSGGGSLSPWATPSPASSVTGSPPGERRTPSPQLRPGYARHEIEGIGGVVKTKLMRMVRVGACVPEWEDEKNKGEILGREVSGRSRSWCGWCWRVIPGKKDWEAAAKAKARAEGDGNEKEKGKAAEKDVR
ncbi:uncharacterized protein F4807DRAFT_436014 [Annulohypoxylon truncatum]|uniref:uncharacterized protein n=1 Tax=Annulohypoxylon truncatum TaxID=327061 RepID=UPI0020073058|nr:uncharacterized protein F4807DRAFT_436014 [Annulohypoxylon truncatum]KAI1207192.1 hypothetical protein F4807DRAFT_436014 [Annulohypoxylon truncatum]